MTPPCPCGRTATNASPETRTAKSQPLPFLACCGRYLNDNAAVPAPDAETLMRSRYSAFVLGRRDYLLATWHASTRPTDLTLDPAAKWLGLEVRSHRVVDAEHAEVEFVARYREGGRATRLHERSRFVRESGRWYYVDGDQF
jgi:SEC-C motif-containing protein